MSQTRLTSVCILLAGLALVSPSPAADVSGEGHIYELKNDLPRLYRLRGQVRLVILGDSRAARGVDPRAFYGPENRRAPLAYNLSVSTSGLDVQETLLRDYLAYLPRLEWVVYGLSPRIFNRYWIDEAGEKMRESAGHARYLRSERALWARPPGGGLLTARTLGPETAPWGWSPTSPGAGGIKTSQIPELMQITAQGRYERDPERWARFEALLDLLEQRGVQMFAFTPPIHYGVKDSACADDDGTTSAAYRALMHDLAELEDVHPNFHFLDVHRKGDNEFRDEHYFNWDHLNADGAALLSARLQEHLARLQQAPPAPRPAALAAVTAVGDPSRVQVVFRRTVSVGDALNAANYSVEPSIQALSVAAGEDAKTVWLRTSPLQEGIEYTLAVRTSSADASAPAERAKFTYVARFVVSNLRPAGATLGEVKVGAPAHAAGEARYTEVPARYAGLVSVRLLQPSDPGAREVSFDVNYPARVFVAYDEAAVQPLAWMASFAFGWDAVVVGERRLQVAWKDWPAGRAVIGGVSGDPDRYVVFVQPLGACPTPRLRASQALDRAQALYDDGKPEEALQVLRDEGQADGPLARTIREVAALGKTFDSAAASGDDAAAAGAAARILELAKAEGNVYRRRAADWLAARSQEAASLLDQARAAEAEGKALDAARLYWRAAALKPDDPDVQQAIRRLRREAQFKYNLALNSRLREPEKALALFREAMAMVPPADPLHERARNAAMALEKGP